MHTPDMCVGREDLKVRIVRRETKFSNSPKITKITGFDIDADTEDTVRIRYGKQNSTTKNWGFHH